MKKTIEIRLDRAKGIYATGGEDIRALLLTTFTKEELEKKEVKCWEDLPLMNGYKVTENGGIFECVSMRSVMMHKTLWATKEQAFASVAMSQLSQLMKEVNGEWEKDYNIHDEVKYYIYFYDNEIGAYFGTSVHVFLSFKTEEIRDTFLENHRELITTAKPLL